MKTPDNIQSALGRWCSTFGHIDKKPNGSGSCAHGGGLEADGEGAGGPESGGPGASSSRFVVLNV